MVYKLNYIDSDQIHDAERWRRDEITKVNVEFIANKWLEDLTTQRRKSMLYWQNNESRTLMRRDLKGYDKIIKIAKHLQSKRVSIARGLYKKFKKEVTANMNVYKIPRNIKRFLNFMPAKAISN